MSQPTLPDVLRNYNWDGIMKAVTVKYPWAGLIIHGDKRCENRGWDTHYRGVILIHTAKADDNEGGNWPIWPHAPEGERTPWQRYYKAMAQECDCEVGSLGFNEEYQGFHKPGHIIGAAIVTGMDRQMKSEYDAEGQWHWRLHESVIAFKRPIPYKGQLGLFSVPCEVLRPYVGNQWRGLQKLEALAKAA